MIDRLHSLPDRALDLASQVGDGFKHLVPDGAGKWLEAGAKLGALKSGTRIAGIFVRRHPAAVAATVAGAGLLWYLARRRARQVEDGVIEGTSKRVEARRGGNGSKRGAASKRGARTRRSRETNATT